MAPKKPEQAASTKQTLKQFREKYGEKVDVFGILQLKPGATEKEISKSYKKLSLLYHPDKQDNNDATMFIKVKEARDLLLDENVKQELERAMNRKKQEEVFLAKQQDARGKMARDLDAREKQQDEKAKQKQKEDEFIRAGSRYVHGTTGDSGTKTGGLSAQLAQIREQNRAFIEQKNEERRRYLREDLDVQVKKAKVGLRDARVLLQVKRKNFAPEVESLQKATIEEIREEEFFSNATKRQMIRRIQSDFEGLEKDRKIRGFEGSVRIFVDEAIGGGAADDEFSSGKMNKGSSSASSTTATTAGGTTSSSSKNTPIVHCELQFETRDNARQCVEFLLTEKATKKKFPFAWINKLPKLCDPGPQLKASDIERVKKRRKLFPSPGRDDDFGDDADGGPNSILQSSFLRADKQDNFRSAEAPRYPSFFAMEKDILGRLDALLKIDG
ncbi:unnamed protein product [Amoebophrya sp. A120]|nr:unnamed protein product [Amoebophrya sp. A120]|eukprot:GSA120T00009402001.1